MAKDKKGFILYCDLIHTFEHLTNEQVGEVTMWILKYTNDLNPEPLNGLLQAVVEPIKQQLKRDLKKFESIKDHKKNSGQLGNLKRWHPDLYEDVVNEKRTLEDSLIIAKNRTATNFIANIAVKDTVTDTVTVKEKDIKNTLEQRKEIFKDEVMAFSGKYTSALLLNFFGYWSEHGKNDNKMRFEKQDSFGISRRLATWFKRSKEGNQDNTKARIAL